MSIQAGDKLPTTTFMKMGPDGPQPVNTGELFSGKRVALFAVPGAFTPTCSAKHLPGFVEKAALLKARGIDCLLYTSPSPRDLSTSRMPSSA